MKKLLSASEIGAMRLPGLPTSKQAVIARAAAEGWYYEEKKGIGGTRRVYEVPAQYLSAVEVAVPLSTELTPTGQIEAAQEEKVAGTIMPGGRSVDLETIKFVDAVLEEWLQKKGLRLKPERRAGILAVLCDYLAKGATEKDLQEMLKVLSA
ncbi:MULTISPECIES: DNA-binding protein [Chromobacterium]|uniref:DNA-binding protein n=1 Tax=Chromobacterium aquaticum TaxID=467180 RepID=A0ABV8ZX19_9NEIS|nr:DNA-binding protein [Chromobacterium haemolyticum]MCD5362761.1 hypothetical protein [Chromobacterium aquaticum]PTU71446.1 hypothetical protein DBB33_19320 [Chromobacterium haemolyticum]